MWDPKARLEKSAVLSFRTSRFSCCASNISLLTCPTAESPGKLSEDLLRTIKIWELLVQRESYNSSCFRALQRVWCFSGFSLEKGIGFDHFWSQILTWCVFYFGLALGILSRRNFFFSHEHWQIFIPSQMFTQMIAISWQLQSYIKPCSNLIGPKWGVDVSLRSEKRFVWKITDFGLR